jgi:nitrogen fixation protein NifU and related proteins
MGSLSELYQNVILEHNRSPRNYRPMENANREAQGHNPLCGDQVTVRLRVDGGRIQDVAFQGSGCAISRASASLMTSAIKGQTPEAATAMFQRFHRLVTGQGGAENPETLGKLAVFSGVSEYPSRVKCASLPWHTMKAALDRGGDLTVSPSPDL